MCRAVTRPSNTSRSPMILSRVDISGLPDVRPTEDPQPQWPLTGILITSLTLLVFLEARVFK